MRFWSASHPLWLVGFRPFFTIAIFFGILMPTLWALIFSGTITLAPNINPIQWHAHEMLYGFGGAILIGFLLTASKNWVHIRGIHGFPLMILTGLWLTERMIFYVASPDSAVLRHMLMSIFITASALYLISTLILNRNKDTFKDNYFFYILLVVIVVAKNLLISETYYTDGIAMSLGLFRLAFAVMFERTITQFMKNTEGVTLLRKTWLDLSIKFLVLLSVFQTFFVKDFAVLVLALAGILLFVRWILWRPDIGFRKFSNATMYIGYLGLVLHFGLEALARSGTLIGAGTVSLHTFTFLCMGVVIPSMLVRISQGHTGRKPEFWLMDKMAISLILISAAVRLILPSLYPTTYPLWIKLAGSLWSVAYLMLAYRLIPFLIKPRIDGKVH